MFNGKNLPKYWIKENVNNYFRAQVCGLCNVFFMIYDLGAVATGDNYLDVNIYVIVPVWVLLLFLS